MAKEKDKKEISLKNTKQEILDALNEALNREKEMTKVKSDPIAEREKKERKSAVEETKVNVESGIFSEQLNEKFKKLEDSLASEEARLKELYGIEDELVNLTLVVNAHKDMKQELEASKTRREKEIQTQLLALEEELRQKEEKLKKDYETAFATLKRERDRESEEYNYKIKRDREIDNDKWLSEKQKRLAAITAEEEETKRLLAEARASADEHKSLVEQVAKIPEMLKEEYEKSKAETTKELKKEFDYEKKLLMTEHKNMIDRQNDKIESLEKEIEKLTNINSSLQAKMDTAYVELKELATKTVEANGGLKIIGNNQSEKI